MLALAFRCAVATWAMAAHAYETAEASRTGRPSPAEMFPNDYGEGPRIVVAALAEIPHAHRVIAHAIRSEPWILCIFVTVELCVVAYWQVHRLRIPPQPGVWIRSMIPNRDTKRDADAAPMGPRRLALTGPDAPAAPWRARRTWRTIEQICLALAFYCAWVTWANAALAYAESAEGRAEASQNRRANPAIMLEDNLEIEMDSHGKSRLIHKPPTGGPTEGRFFIALLEIPNAHRVIAHAIASKPSNLWIFVTVELCLLAFWQVARRVKRSRPVE